MSSQLLPPNSTLLERAVAEATSFDLSTSHLRHSESAELCPPQLLPWLAWERHVDSWDDSTTTVQQRKAISISLGLHKKKGTRWAVQRALSVFGFYIEIIEQRDQRAMYAELNPHYLDGTWRLNGAVCLRALDRQMYCPQIDHWAKFIVRMNLADVSDMNLTRVKKLVDEWKPVSRHAIWQFWLSLIASHNVMSSMSISACLFSSRLYPWETRSLSARSDAVWRLGKDGSWPRLDARPFGFSFAKTGVVSGYQLAEGRARSDITVHLPMMVANVFAREYLARDAVVALQSPVRLYQRLRRLDGSWKLTVSRFNRPFGFRFGGQSFYDSNRLDGSWTLGEHHITRQPARLRLNGRWLIGGPVSAEFELRRII